MKKGRKTSRDDATGPLDTIMSIVLASMGQGSSKTTICEPVPSSSRPNRAPWGHGDGCGDGQSPTHSYFSHVGIKTCLPSREWSREILSAYIHHTIVGISRLL